MVKHTLTIRRQHLIKPDKRLNELPQISSITHNKPGNQVISTRNHMFGGAIWDKLPSAFIPKMRLIYPQNSPNQTCDYCLITSNHQTLCIETNIFQQRAITDQ